MDTDNVNKLIELWICSSLDKEYYFESLWNVPSLKLIKSEV